MEDNRTLFPVIKTEEYKINTIIKNTLTMLSNRIYVDSNGNKNSLLVLEEAAKTIEDRGDNVFIIKADNGDLFALKIIFQKISAIGKQSLINEFLKEYAQFKKIIIARDFNNKIVEYVLSYHTQIFKESSLLQDIISHRDQPRFELLSPSEMEKFKTEYNATEYTTKKMLRSDPVAKYFALKKGDIIRIIRPSPTAGEAIDYRIVM